jgi:hypothetical protein
VSVSALPPVNGGTGITSYTTGDILYASATNVLSKRAIGTTGQVLTVSGGVPVWASSSSFTWNVVGAGQAIAVNNGYICTTGAALSFSLPATSAVGDTIALSLKGSTSWTITQAASQQIHLGSSSTTAGVGGSLASLATGDTITLVCMTANLTWICTSVVGNITVV